MTTQHFSKGESSQVEESQPADFSPAVVFKYEELQEATKNFHRSERIGIGGHSVVYRGKLKDGKTVAVKGLYINEQRQKSRRTRTEVTKQFLNEVHILSNLSHKNLVKLYGSTNPEDEKLFLVYELLPGGTVADHLRGKREKTLSWDQRIKIAIETAEVLSFLHNFPNSSIIHRDVKTEHILLDNNFNVKLVGFGMSRLLPCNDWSPVCTLPQGTQGYLDPEYNLLNKVTTKSDVYSFGVVLLELISGEPALDVESEWSDGFWLANTALKRIQNNNLDKLVDPSLGYNSDEEIQRMVTLVAKLARRCLQLKRTKKPPMQEVLKILKDIRDGKQPDMTIDSSSMNHSVAHVVFLNALRGGGLYTLVRGLEIEVRKATLCPQLKEAKYIIFSAARIASNKVVSTQGRSYIRARGGGRPPRNFVKKKRPVLPGSSLSNFSPADHTRAVLLPPSRLHPKSTYIKEEESLFGFDLEELEKATQFFNPASVLGRGGYGVVYRGKLKDGQIVAVKELVVHHHKRTEQFLNEVRVVSGLFHKNLVGFYGFTNPEDKRLYLVYEFVPNGTVADHLHHRENEGLSWDRRIKIAIQTAKALVYLHSLQPPIIHRDVKTENLLLDNEFNVKLADFGLCLRLPTDGSPHVTAMPQGTRGYMDPEYTKIYEATTKSDVYSFGVVLVALITGNTTLDNKDSPGEVDIEFILSKLTELLDEQLKDQFKEAASMGELARRCMQRKGANRPSMLEVLMILKDIRRGKQLSKTSATEPLPDYFGVLLNQFKSFLEIYANKVGAIFEGYFTSSTITTTSLESFSHDMDVLVDLLESEARVKDAENTIAASSSMESPTDVISVEDVEGLLVSKMDIAFSKAIGILKCDGFSDIRIQDFKRISDIVASRAPRIRNLMMPFAKEVMNTLVFTGPHNIPSWKIPVGFESFMRRCEVLVDGTTKNVGDI